MYHIIWLFFQISFHLNVPSAKPLSGKALVGCNSLSGIILWISMLKVNGRHWSQWAKCQRVRAIGSVITQWWNVHVMTWKKLFAWQKNDPKYLQIWLLLFWHFPAMICHGWVLLVFLSFPYNTCTILLLYSKLHKDPAAHDCPKVRSQQPLLFCRVNTMWRFKNWLW